MARKKRAKKLPIAHWSHSSLMAFLRNPLTWHKRYVQKVYDTPATPSSVVGRAGHIALQHFYQGVDKETAIALGLEYLRAVPDFELNFGTAKSKQAKRAKRESMEREYLQAINFYLAKPPRHQVLGVEVKGVAKVKGLPLPLKAISDLVVASRVKEGAVDVVDHKFVAAFSNVGKAKSLFVLQAIFNYYTVRELYGREVARFIVYECKKSRSAKGSVQLKRHIIDFREVREDFAVFHRLINDATRELSRREVYLPNPSDIFEGDHSFDLYRLNLTEEPEDIED